MPFGNSPIIKQKLWNSKKFFFAFYGSKMVFWVKKRCFGAFWISCEVADPETKTENDRNGPQKQDPIVGVTHR